MMIKNKLLYIVDILLYVNQKIMSWGFVVFPRLNLAPMYCFNNGVFLMDAINAESTPLWVVLFSRSLFFS